MSQACIYVWMGHVTRVIESTISRFTDFCLTCERAEACVCVHEGGVYACIHLSRVYVTPHIYV